ncbi:hypothetical protein ACEZCY_25935 [Streptacidiphilus sp. N1-12]|uniref:Uncharacterized protein n=2 Tax=Streptacidiphilus alkalitolerans TaxID=3342712 RepID=A0ABV6V7T9_9ACTN
MADARPYRPGQHVEYQGYAYRCFGDSRSPMITICLDEGDPVPEGLEPDPGRSDGFYLVDPRDVTAWYSSRWTFRWKGELFSSGGVRDGEINGYYQGTKGSAFADAYLTRMGAIEYEGDFPLEEVTDITEERFDLLASWKEKHPE